MDEWMVYIIFKKHCNLLQVMFDQCRQLQIYLNLKKCIFVVPFGALIGHIIYKDGVCVDATKVTIIMNMSSPTSVKQLHSTLGHTGYYRWFIRNYLLITAPLEKLLKKAEHFLWTDECDTVFYTLKEKLVSALILVYPYWNKQFHVHIDASGITLGVILDQLGEGNLDHPI